MNEIGSMCKDPVPAQKREGVRIHPAANRQAPADDRAIDMDVVKISQQEQSPQNPLQHEVAEKLRDQVREENLKARIHFSRDEKSGDTILTIVDPKTGEARQIPPKTLLDRMSEIGLEASSLKSVLVDTKS